AQITESQQLLAETQTGLENRHPSYAVVPYEGQHGTRRRPIYLDCREDAIVLQPEGITLTEHDFRAPLGPDNPLASVLRVSSEYLNTSQGGEQGRPYPLLLVRPAGIRAYYAARAALKSWDAEFGYELIGDDWEIEYPAADPQLAQVASQELILARKRHEMYLVRHRSGSGGSGRGGSGSGGGPGSGYRGEGQGEESPAAGGGFGGSADDGGPAAAGTAAANGGMSPAAEGTLTGPSPQGPATASQGQTSAGDFDSAAASAAAGGQSAVSVADQNLAETRGRDWALPDASRDAVPFSRPIRIEVHANQIMIVPRDANDKLQVIAAQGPTQEVIEEFVSAVWGHMKGWGIAGRGMYWKPILNVYVAAGGDRRAAEMEILLEGSGLEVNRLDR
nr:hypothetical protein [Planctomycetales bacterium]